MNNSIRNKLFFIFVIFLFVFVFMSLLISRYFLDDLMMYGSKSSMSNVFYKYRKQINEDEYNLDLYKDISNSYGLGVLVIEGKQVKYCNSRLFCHMNMYMIPDEVQTALPNIQIGESEVFVLRNIHSLSNQLVLIGRTNQDHFLILDQPVGSYEKIKDVLQVFVIVSGLAILIIGSIIVYFVSRRFTKPIIEISDRAEEIANLNFKQKLNIGSRDEIGDLAVNMNKISNKLDVTLTDLHDTNEKLKVELMKEKERERIRLKFFSTASHELKTPITIIQGYADGLKNNVAKSKEDVDYYTNVIIEETKKMNNLVHDLLNLSLYESGNFNIRKESFDLVDVVSKSATKYHQSIKTKDVKLSLNLPQKSIVIADKVRIEQAIMNFLSNAVKHVGEQGLLSITLQDDSKHTKVTVFNTGELINPNEMNTIWNLFYESGNESEFVGTGLGLAIVKSIIELHKGEYGVANKNDGVMFWFSIPKE
ncbi:sensor histidine kinase [Haloplasma contractile]|uniref:histidine kinase n=1 Tax=Haloplasma contractile SSD-17B TaxID=1033810 RepID=U2EF76_9MOLU|nr:HAMP domain-containing sensor histidine kinase [Haloplasma contractile]ERJ13583.1 two-component system OmpR family sensor histidine kinase ResE protein [Haloplasma contractile SSD-17B]